MRFYGGHDDFTSPDKTVLHLASFGLWWTHGGQTTEKR